jgi:hypothetical protein
MTPAATACSWKATHFGRPVGSGVGDVLRVAVGALVTGGADRVALGAGESVPPTLVGALQDTSITARSQRDIAGR